MDMQSSTFEHNQVVSHMQLKQSAKLWLDMVVSMVRHVLVFNWTVIIPEAPLVYDRSHKGVSILVFRIKSSWNS
jgi:hypothetical protein